MVDIAPVRFANGEPPDLGEPLFDIEFVSTLEAGRKAVNEALESLRQRGMLEDCELNAWLCLEELVTNAIRHGNRNDPNKSGRLRIYPHDHAWTARVEDQGEGFDPRDLPDPLEHLEHDHGRGIFLIRAIMGNLSYYRGGRCAEFECRPGAGSAAEVTPRRSLQSANGN